MNSNEKDYQSSDQKKVIIFKFSHKKKIINRDWPEESFLSSKEKNVKTISKKKSVSFNKETQDIPTPDQDSGTCTPSKQLKGTAKTIRSCKEHIKTPYSKSRVNDDEVEYSYSKARERYELGSLHNSEYMPKTPPPKALTLIDNPKMLESPDEADQNEDIQSDNNQRQSQSQTIESKGKQILENNGHNKENIEPTDIDHQLCKIQNDLLQENDDDHWEHNDSTEKIEEDSDDENDESVKN